MNRNVCLSFLKFLPVLSSVAYVCAFVSCVCVCVQEFLKVSVCRFVCVSVEQNIMNMERQQGEIIKVETALLWSAGVLKNSSCSPSLTRNQNNQCLKGQFSQKCKLTLFTLSFQTCMTLHENLITIKAYCDHKWSPKSQKCTLKSAVFIFTDTKPVAVLFLYTKTIKPLL